MAYTPTTWTDNATQANAARLNKLEQGVKAAHDLAEAGGGGGGGAVNSVNGKTGTVVLDAADVGAQPAGDYAATVHTHSAADVNSGTLADARIPALNASKTTSGTFALARIPTGTTGSTVALGNHGHTEYVLATQAINAQTGTTYTLVAGDAGKMVTAANAGAVTVTVPASTFTAGQRVDVLQRGAGSLTLAAGAGMTLNGTPSLVTRAQWSAVSVLFLSATEGVVIGDLAQP